MTPNPCLTANPGTRHRPVRALLQRAGAGLLLALAAVALAACASTRPPEGVVAVSPFDLSRYQGRWYEIARLDHSYERGLTDVSADYTPRSDGSVRVVNRGYDPARKAWRDVEGKAVFTGAPTTGSLKVSFFGPFYSGYHVVALDPDYRWALVLGSDKRSCWILARDRKLESAQRDGIVARARQLGVDTSALIWVSQEREDGAG